MPDDDPHERLRSLPQFNSFGVRTFGTNLLTDPGRSDRLAIVQPLTPAPPKKSNVSFTFSSCTAVDAHWSEPWNRSFTCERARPRGGCTPTSTDSRTTSSAAADSPAAPPTCTAATTPPRTAARARCAPSTCWPSELKPSDATDARGGPMLMFSNADCQVLLSRRSEPMPFFVRYVDGDLLCFVHKGAGLLETEFGPLRYREGDWVYIPKACTCRQVPDDESTLLMIQATDEFRVPPPGTLGRHFPFDPSQAVIPEPAPIDDPATGRRRRVRGAAHPRRVDPTTLYLPTPSARRRGLARRQLPVHVQHRRLQRRDLRQRAPAADRAPLHAGHRRLRDELPAQARRERAGYRAHAVVSPQRRLRRDRVLPRRFALRHPDAARPDFACAARRSPRCAGEGARTGPPQVRRVRQGGLVGDRHRHPSPAHPVRRRPRQRSRGRH